MSSHTSPAAAVVDVVVQLVVVALAELAVVVVVEDDVEEVQTPLVQVSPVAQFPVYVPCCIMIILLALSQYSVSTHTRLSL